MDYAYALKTTRERIAVLQTKIKAYNNSKDLDGNELKYRTACQYRTLTTQDLNLCILIEELLLRCKLKGELELSEEAERALERLTEPCERHGGK